MSATVSNEPHATGVAAGSAAAQVHATAKTHDASNIRPSRRCIPAFLSAS
jgi:hypothetical protein